MLDFSLEYNRWLENENLPSKLSTELKELTSEEEIKDRFYQDLTFGTAGLRGKLGAGTNRMNELVVARATLALARVIKEDGENFAKRGVAIAHDSRIKSKEFAMLCARVLASEGIKSHLYDTLKPTPMLSFAVRHLNAAAGINITASHNPKEYNGYKVYWQEGSQIKDDIANRVLEKIKKIDLHAPLKLEDFETGMKNGLISYIPSSCDEAYYKGVLNLRLAKNIDKSIKIVYTPLNGAGNIPVRHVLKEMGFENVFVVKEQEEPDGTFPTIEYPNPEDLRAFEYANKLAEEKGADIIIATDPDSDRLAVEVMKDGKIKAFNGNQIGVLMIYYILSRLKEQGRLPENAAIVKSIVTGDMGKAIAEDFGVKTFDVLTGFKNISELPNIWDKTGEYTFVFGYEESIGYNPGNFVRDKDAVSSSMILAEMVAYYKTKGKTLDDVLNELFEKYGYYSEITKSLSLEGIEGASRIKRMMDYAKSNPPNSIAGINIEKFTDYQESYILDIKTSEKNSIDIEKTNAVRYSFEDGSWVSLRPSGTEPKIKIYIYTVDKQNMENASKKRDNLAEEMVKILENIN